MSDLPRIDLDVPFYTDLLKGKCIGFGGKLGSGKSFISDCLIEYIHKNSSVKAVRRSFADELRNCAEHDAGIPVREYKHQFTPISAVERAYCYEKMAAFIERNDFTMDFGFLFDRFSKCETHNDLYRVTLQLIGTELFRLQRDMDYWANSVGRNLDPNVITVIDDIRFPNELNVVKNNGVSVYSILLEKLESHVDLYVESHASETSVGAADFEVIFHNMVDKNRATEAFGKSVFNTVAPFYYLFKVLSDEPEKEKYLRRTIKSSCNS